MLQIILWALGTGFVTGAVWFAIVTFQRRPRPEPESPALPPETAEPKAIDDVQRRLLELEERLDTTEHVLMRDKIEQFRKQRG